MTEQERFTIEKDSVNEKLCIWDYDDLICEIDDDKTLITLVNLLNKLNKENEELKEEKYAYLGEITLYKGEANKRKKENEELKQCIDNMGGRLQGLWAHYNANRYEIWGRAVEDVAKELGFKIYKPGDAPISMSDLKKKRINSVKKLNKRLRDLGVLVIE